LAGTVLGGGEGGGDGGGDGIGDGVGDGGGDGSGGGMADLAGDSSGALAAEHELSNGLRPGTIDGRGTKESLEAGVQADVDAMLQLTRANESASSNDEEPPPKRRRGALAAAAAEAPRDARYGTLSTQARAHFEARGDWAAARPMVSARDHSKSGKFDTVRLRGSSASC